MKYETITKNILREFLVGKNYVGYNYIIYGIHLIEIDKGSIGHITKTLYIDIANKYNTTSICVERGIRSTVEIMWKNKMRNKTLLIEIFGKSYLPRRPSNTKFFELLYDYVESYSPDGCNINCPFSGCKYCKLRRDESV